MGTLKELFRRRALHFGLWVAVVTALAAGAGFRPPQVVAVGVFSAFIIGSLLFWSFRLAFALAGVSVLLAGRLVDLPHLMEFAQLDVILFLVGMMTLIGFLEERGFFEAVLERVLAAVGGSAKTLVLSILALSYLSAALVDEVTSILFMTALVLKITRRYNLEPLPFLILTVFATNIGSCATVVGNPIGVMIAMQAKLGFPDFLRWATPISFAALVLTVGLGLLYYRKEIRALEEGLRREGLPAAAAPRPMLMPALLFGATIAGLVLHKNLEKRLGLAPNTMLVATALAAGGIALLLEHKRARQLVEKHVDWWTLTFFLLLFASTGTLRYVGVTERIAHGITGATDGEIVPITVLTTWSIGFLTSVMDNVVAVASFLPVVADLAEAGVPAAPLWWAILFGGTILGNLTLIGSTANIVALGILDREGHRPITFWEWFKPGALTAIPSLALANLLLVLQIPLLIR